MKTYTIYLFFMAFVNCCSGSGNRAGISWGTVSNEFQLGVSVQTVFAAGSGADRQTILFLGTTNTSTKRILFCPPEFETFQIKLHNSRSEDMPKTRFGKKFGREPKKTVSFTDVSLKGANRWKIVSLPEEWNVQIRFFNLFEHFKGIESGEYDLSVELRVYYKDDKGKLSLIKLPHSVRIRVN